MRRWLLALALVLGGCPVSTGVSTSDAGADAVPPDLAPDRSSSDFAVDQQVDCPPSGPYGLALGETVQPLEFLDADGQPMSLHSFCGQPLTLVYHYYGW